ncbi:hypothetical protein SARC_03431 [Sphaeroforma arctica JP610]|uniref:CDP-alcohol phosphatidyltransferase n=1 Tax=Sphaeroforma arctica JP610 TaxID=667725 RepID=A0A0L0G664_9EUKA|nr:hypothetical protein SARC_03431 [Sphaeroforma arctica JP610]KNC84351.1 hypothetical protein SARC_03431 [Sphaeroforma arctica JP610]|eukprot:XP_014158253.1 hypothetical protein SARC_03431 [Sphaeroforma arctica JP610]
MPGITRGPGAIASPSGAGSMVDKLILYTESEATVFTALEIQNLKAHRYQSQDGSYLNKYVMNPYWNTVVSYVPTWVAPNVLTLLGLSSIILSTGVLMYYCPTLSGEAPRWVYFLCAICLHVYQTLDAIDGKQAKRTNTGSVIGELMDHGCDSITTILTLMGTVAAIDLGADFGSFRLIMATLVGFYLAHWNCYVTGGLEFGIVDVTEAQMQMMLVHILTGFFGPDVWKTQVFGTASLRACFMTFGIVFVMVSIMRSLRNVVMHEAPTGSLANDSRYEPAAAILAFVAIVSGLMLSCDLWEERTALFCWCIGIVNSKIVCRLIVSHMAKTRMVSWDKSLACLMLLLASTRMSSTNDHVSLQLASVYVTVQFVGFAWRAIKQLSLEFNIPVLSIPYPNIATLKERGVKDVGMGSKESYFTEASHKNK